jgi:hypothetical protein
VRRVVHPSVFAQPRQRIDLRFERKRLRQGGLSLVDIAVKAESRGEPQMHIEPVRITGARLREELDCADGVVKQQMTRPQLPIKVRRIRVMGIESKSPLDMRDRCLRLAEKEKGLAKVEVGAGVVAV